MIPMRSVTAIGTLATAAAAVAAAVAAMPDVAQANEFQPYTGQATTLLNVRRTPSTQQPRMGQLSPGDTFQVTGIAGKSEAGNWLRITYKNGTAYVDGTYVSRKQTAASVNPTQSVQSIQHYQAFTTDFLNVRFLPSTKGTILTTLKSGSTVTVIGKTTDGWLQIQYKGGAAYVSAQYIKASASQPALSVSQASLTVLYTGTTTDALNVRSGASTTTKIMTTLKKGSGVQVVGTSGSWLKIKYSNGTAYVSAEYVKKPGATATTTTSAAAEKVLYTGTTTDALNVRSGASTATKIMTTLKKGSNVQVVGTSGSWLKIKYNNDTAYVSAEYVKKPGATATTTTSAAAEKVLYTGTTTDALNVRSGASTATKIMTTLKKGSSVQVVGTSGSWLKIKYNNGTAYVSAEYVKKPDTTTAATTTTATTTTTKTAATTAPSAAAEKVLYTGTTTADALNVRSGASTATKILATLNAGSSVQVVGTSGSWLKIKFENGDAFVSADYVTKSANTKTTAETLSSMTPTGTKSYGIITGSGVNFRKGPGTDFGTLGSPFDRGTKVEWLTSTDNGWVKVGYNNTDGYVSSDFIKKESVTTYQGGNTVYQTTQYPLSFGQALTLETKVSSYSASELAYYLNPNNFQPNTADYFQFLKLSSLSGVTAAQVNAMLKGDGSLDGHGADFVNAAKKYGVNELYLVAHALLETGYGQSELATGVNYKGYTVYNMFGIGAFDVDPVNGGAALALIDKWYTPSAAIWGGAEWIAANYIYNSSYQQDTLYKMRWNPDALASGSAAHQYATDPGWAIKQTSNMEKLYLEAKMKNLLYDVPQYN